MVLEGGRTHCYHLLRQWQLVAVDSIKEYAIPPRVYDGKRELVLVMPWRHRDRGVCFLVYSVLIGHLPVNTLLLPYLYPKIYNILYEISKYLKVNE